MSFQRLASRLILMVSALFLAMPVLAQDLYSVRGVEVEASASDASQARQAAIAMGQGRALQRLWGRLIPGEMESRTPSLSSQQIENLIEDFSVSRERTDDRRYSAVLNVRFRPSAVRNVLRDANIPYAEQQAPPLLLLPVYSDDEGMRLWKDPNPWRAAWQRRQESGLVPVTIAMGDLRDVSAIDAERAAARDREALEEIASVYDVEEVIITIARLSGDPESDSAGLSIELRRIGGDHEGAMNMVSLRQKDSEPLERFYDRAVAQVDKRIQEEWKRENVLRFDEQQEILVRVPVQSLQQWVQLQQRLKNNSRITEALIRHLTREEGILALSFLGDEESLAGALTASGLALEPLEEVPDGWPAWKLTSRQAPLDSLAFEGAHDFGGDQRVSGPAGPQPSDRQRNQGGPAIQPLGLP